MPVRRKLGEEDRERKAANEHERRKLIEERRLKTYHGYAAHTDEDVYRGRFASVNTIVVTGASPGSAFPKLPDGPWEKNELPDEPLINGTGEGSVLGYEIDRPDVVSPASVVAPVDAGDGDGPSTDTGRSVIQRKFVRRF